MGVTSVDEFLTEDENSEEENVGNLNNLGQQIAILNTTSTTQAEDMFVHYGETSPSTGA